MKSMKFENITDLIQVFANEYSLPGNKVLCLGLFDHEIKRIFEFIGSHIIFVKDTPNDLCDIISDYHDLPFEERSFDLILNFTEYTNLFKFIKESGHILTSGEILNGVDYYYHRGNIFTVI